MIHHNHMLFTRCEKDTDTDAAIFFTGSLTLNHNIMGPLRNILPRQKKTKHNTKNHPNSPTFNYNHATTPWYPSKSFSNFSKRCRKNNILDFLTAFNPLETPVAQEPFWKKVWRRPQARWSSSKVSPGKSCKSATTVIVQTRLQDENENMLCFYMFLVYELKHNAL